jgi:S1-C subfamily serine protease
MGKPLPLEPGIALARERLGLIVKLMTPLMAGELNIQQDDGLYIDGIVPGGVAEHVGKLVKGDILTGLTLSADRQPTPIRNLDDLAKYLKDLAPDAKLRMTIARGDSRKVILFDLAAATTQPTTMPAAQSE